MNLINGINQRYVCISNKITPRYECTFGLPCDLYFPIFDPYAEDVKYRNMEIFAPHQSCTYNDVPDKTDVKFYIPYLIKKDAMNSPESEFDAFYTEDEIDRPFIETTKRRELPIQTKVVVKQGQSIMSFFVDKKLVVTGANGFMLLRMYLSPLEKDDDGDYVFVPPEPPVDPDIPTDPDTPVDPDIPTDPDTPVDPDIPTDPEVPPTDPEVPQGNEGAETTPPDNFPNITMNIPD